ncbi:amidohydrolase family protein [Actinomycetospora chlora]|uniref:Amidohydrolase family protein n=1 Tax=Actinomycetospora chlora TaxID=663608 RepID=A0ABP9A2K9_9PSEU
MISRPDEVASPTVRPRLLVAARVVPAPGEPAIAPGAVLVDGPTIAAVGPPDALAAARPDAERVDLAGATLVPGLVNVHVHLAFEPERDPVTPPPERPTPDLAAAVARNALRLLDEGVTTARDLGDRDGVVAAWRASGAPGPRVLTSRTPLTSPGGHCWFLGGEVRGDVRDAVRHRADQGADWIKVMAGGGMLTPSSPRPWESQFDDAALAALLAAAREVGLPVAAHAHGTATMAACARAGVDTIEHGGWLAGPGPSPGAAPATDPRPEVADAIAASGAVLVPTRARGWRTWPPEADRDGLLARLAWNASRGIRMVVGTDAGAGPGVFDDVVDTLTLYRAAGFPDAAVLAMATTEAAAVLGLADRIGRLAPGYAADVLAVDGDPTRDVEALRRLRLVVAAGRAHLPRA